MTEMKFYSSSSSDIARFVPQNTSTRCHCCFATIVSLHLPKITVCFAQEQLECNWAKLCQINVVTLAHTHTHKGLSTVVGLKESRTVIIQRKPPRCTACTQAHSEVCVTRVNSILAQCACVSVMLIQTKTGLTEIWCCVSQYVCISDVVCVYIGVF